MTRSGRVLRIFAVLVLASAAFLAGALLFRGRGAPTSQQASGGRKILYYRDPMNSQVTSSTPKKDAMGMDFVPVYADEAGVGGDGGSAQPPLGAGPNTVRVDARMVQETGVTTEPAKLRRLGHTVRTVGMVRPDERRLYTVTVKFAGWAERLYVNFTGDRVRRGEPLAEIYSPDLLATQREYLLAMQYARSLGQAKSGEARAEAENLVQSARRRLLLWDIPEHEIEALASRGEPNRTMMIRSPTTGVVLEKEITTGSQVQPGMTLLRIADLREVWVFAQIFPFELPWILEGQAVDLEVPGIPGKTLQGSVSYIQPVVSSEARTVEVRIQVTQPGSGILLKPNMYSNVKIRSPLQHEALAIREQAVIRSGERNVAIIALGNGYFQSRDVRLGAAGDGYVEILEGIKPGEHVVTSSQFLLDSEANLRSALGAINGGAGGAKGHAGHTSGAPVGGSGQALPPQPEKREQAPSGHQGHKMAPEVPAAPPPGKEHGDRDGGV